MEQIQDRDFENYFGAKNCTLPAKQAQRDELKNIIFEKYDIPLYRFSTTGSNEKERLNEILRNHLYK